MAALRSDGGAERMRLCLHISAAFRKIRNEGHALNPKSPWHPGCSIRGVTSYNTCPRLGGHSNGATGGSRSRRGAQASSGRVPGNARVAPDRGAGAPALGARCHARAARCLERSSTRTSCSRVATARTCASSTRSRSPRRSGRDRRESPPPETHAACSSEESRPPAGELTFPPTRAADLRVAARGQTLLMTLEMLIAKCKLHI